MLPRYESSHSSALTVNGILRSHDINFQGHTIKTIIYNEVDVLKWRGQPPRVELVSADVHLTMRCTNACVRVHLEVANSHGPGAGLR